MLRYRLLTAFVLIPIVLVVAYLGGWALFVVLGIGLILCGYEYYLILAAGGYRTERLLGLALIAALLLAALLNLNIERESLLALVVIPPLWELRRQEHQNFLSDWALTALGVIYIGIPGSCLFYLSSLPNGGIWLIITLLATWAADTAAYFVGNGIGKRPFFQRISPKKTWEGAIGGVAGAMIVFGLLSTFFGIPAWLAFAGGIGLGVAGAVGDLAESLIKRQVGVKDSGTLLLGHGGVLDRLDSFLFTVVFAFYFFSITAR